MAQASQDSSLRRTSTVGSTSSRKIWQTGSDGPLRAEMAENILQLFIGIKPLAPEWRLKIEAFAKNLEQEMYFYTATKEEYADLESLEGRLQKIARFKLTRSQVQQGPLQQLLSRGLKVESDTGVVGEFSTQEGTQSQVVSSIARSQSSNSKFVCTSLIELFTKEMILGHLASLRQSLEHIKVNRKTSKPTEHRLSDHACSLCQVEKLIFEPPSMYCTGCSIVIESYGVYYTDILGESVNYWCTKCYNVKTSDMKATLEIRKNDKEEEESWVQCHKCQRRNHQICALFNGRLDGGESQHTCAQCLISEIESGTRKMLPTSCVLGAKDLPTTLLSDHLEERLTSKLVQDRTKRARALNRSIEGIPGADGLVVRVVSSVEKKVKVKKCFVEIFEEEYPTEFVYKSKVLLLFQNIGGVDVCLFGMYVQEFGEECENPNKRCVYLAYLDSVKYFTPDIKAASGEALRTYVYHEMLVGYLDYCKRRGFGSCYIWACAPLKGDDYIFNRHPGTQMTPKSDKLRKWYRDMLQKATNEGIVVECTNLYDYYFVSKGECKAKITAAALPYFDGDYWPAAVDEVLENILPSAEEKRQRRNRKTTTKGASMSAMEDSKDILFMKKLGQEISPVKKACIVVHLHDSCTHCRSIIVSGKFWACKKCKKFLVCNTCYDAELGLDNRSRHPLGSKVVHELTFIRKNDVLLEAKDEDELIESEYFDTRQAFGSLCKGNHYQYDTLRRAKHSSMMLLYHLHNPTASGFVITCNSCSSNIETGSGWQCTSCEDFDLCNNCRDLSQHQHPLSPHPSASERNPENKEARQGLQTMLVVLVHASRCRIPGCRYSKCPNIKALFQHGSRCEVRDRGGCTHCKTMWLLLKIHAGQCKESETCQVPRCKELKERFGRILQEEESKRGAVVMEMMRRSATEAEGVASSTQDMS